MPQISLGGSRLPPRRRATSPSSLPNPAVPAPAIPAPAASWAGGESPPQSPPARDDARPGLVGGHLIGDSPAFRKTLGLAARLAATDAMVLITGATGTGKELVARAIHYNSPRRNKPFVALNCGALPESLAESELFGHARGAFTDAVAAQRGLVSEAEGGTLFLDEVDSLSLAIQSKLLRFLQDLEYRPVGEPKSRVADVRILTATNADLAEEVATRRFRADLYYRLNVLRLDMPRLAERCGDVTLLALHFVERFARQHGRRTPSLTPDALAKLSAHPWPGNVRELQSVLQRSLLLSPGSELRGEDIDLPAPAGSAGPAFETAQERSFQEAKAQAIEDFERDYLTQLLARCRGNVSEAARCAGKERSAFQRLLRKHGLQRASFQS